MFLCRTDKDKEQILEYLKRDIANCLYIYMDIRNYGFETADMSVYKIENQSEADYAVVMKYYDSFQIYYDKECLSQNQIDEIVDLINLNPVKMISGPKNTIMQLESILDKYKSTYGVIYKMDKYRRLNSNIEVNEAKEFQTREIAELICKDDEIGGHYEIESLARQLADRIATKTGRSYIISEGDRVVAHTATYAETSDLAVVGGTIIDEEYRNTNFYIVIINYLLDVLEKEGKEVYTFSISNRMIQFHEKIHTKCGEYGKLERC